MSNLFGEGFPYTNFHNLNMDWIIKIAKDFLDQYTTIQQIIADGKTSIENATDSGLEQLQSKANEIEGLLNRWYETHSEDIANQLADALDDIDDTLTEAISDFNTSAEEKARQVIASIPEDYTTFYNSSLKEYTPLTDTFDVWSDMPDVCYANQNAEKFSQSISIGSQLITGYTYQIVKILNRVYISCPAVNQYFLGQYSSITQAEYWEDAIEQEFVNRGVIADNTDIDTVKTSGIWFIDSSRTYTHSPFASSIGGILLVFKYSNNTVLQIACPAGDNTLRYRCSYLGSFNTDWGISNIEFINRGAVPTNTDLDTIKTSGIWFLQSAYTYTHSPFASGIGGVLLVFKYSNNSVLQIASQAGTGTVMFRTSLLGDFPPTWGSNGEVITNNYTTEHFENTYNITCTPSITTDTNNYLATTGDTTDRTGAIQTMLNSTGICRLGPGDFYVTGIDIPTFGMLSGCGNATRIILATSVTTGYAVKLGNYSCVKDIRIVGATSNYTPVAVAGTRHGILFEATSDAQTSPTRKYNATIQNCTILDFHGGAITCNNTGNLVDNCLEVSNIHIKRCDIGINVAYLSEFHEFSNVEASGCYYGCICNGGNCLFSNCNFSGNTVGILIDNESGQSPNNAHGVFSCCKIAHSGANTGIGIKVIGSAYNENFNGISFDYGQIVIDSCSGVMFTGCRFGKNTTITVTDSNATIFSSCIIREVSSMSVTSTNSTTHFVNCYDSATGNVYNPLNE